MSLFSCAKCGTVENTALGRCGHPYFLNSYKDDKTKPQLDSYREILGIPPGEDFKQYCSACCPMWFNKKEFGMGPNPNPTPGNGLWHGRFKRNYLPLGMFETNPNTGNLRKVGEQKDCENLEDYFIKEEPADV